MKAMRAFALTIAMLGLVAAVSSCTPQSPNSETAVEAIAKLKRRAASDFNCTEDKVRTNSLDDRTKVAEGCGVKATYVETCERCDGAYAYEPERCNCTWVMDTRNR